MASEGPFPGQIMREERKRAGFTQEALAAAIGCSKPQLSLMESGRRTLSIERAKLIEQVLGVTDQRIVAAVKWHVVPEDLQQTMTDAHILTSRLRDALAGDRPLDELRAIVEQSETNIEPMVSTFPGVPGRRRIPLINKVAAGYPAEFTDLDYPLNIADEYVECPDVTDPQAFAARVVGDSMEPDYREGEVVVFSPEMPTPSGTDCFVRLERDNETTFKRIYLEDDGRTIRLQPLNGAYPPRSVDREDVSGLWAAAYVLRKVGNQA